MFFLSCVCYAFLRVCLFTYTCTLKTRLYVFFSPSLLLYLTFLLLLVMVAADSVHILFSLSFNVKPD